MTAYLDRLCAGEDLGQDEARALFDRLVKGEMDPVEISALLVALKAKGESPEEIAGAAESMRASAVPFARPSFRFADTCGTGGDMSHTVNISTATALIAAEMGIPVAKHGNRSISSKCGSADVLEMLGVKIDASPEVAGRCLDEVKICFLFAPAYHPGMRFAMPVRRALKTRTVFNILGPLINPAAPSVQIVGVYDKAKCVPIAETLKHLGVESALAVHGSGLDEIALHGPTHAALLKNGAVEPLTITPESAGLKARSIEELRGGTPEENAKTLSLLLEGKGKSAHAEAAALNAGALAFVFGKSASIKEGCAEASDTLASGRCADRLAALKEVSNGV
jgi:anthranilate phosphoribosyltransferase